jgi:hypothetical protein
MTGLAIALGIGLAVGGLGLLARRRRPQPSLQSRLLAAHIAQATRRY